MVNMTIRLKRNATLHFDSIGYANHKLPQTPVPH